MTETSIRNNRALEISDDKLLEIKNDGGKITYYLWSVLSKVTDLENASQFKLIKYHNSKRVNDL